ncbi:unnamed protein product [Prorocentrum cordatum]|uniref:Uncharacterized protein n=1 Tax=Prorocentrum cordatum TaxID=2364126 RepID=A0ABN9V5K6_9DINO|nr:unnamed protein product [Polarella glacialis]
MLAKVLRHGDRVCDLGAFAGHYSAWLNDTGLVTAHAYDAAEDIEVYTEGRVRHASLADASLDVGLCDVSLCLEAPALRNLDKHSRRALVVSWALPDIPAVGHHNPKSAAEAREAISGDRGIARLA